ncbi:hypothetical protein, partial [Leptospira congkakensis]|uniref:hypothetical protein n=1 Tax=Leptospira congkakensis TaxID=2484932 RepID=UPI001AEF77A8
HLYYVSLRDTYTHQFIKIIFMNYELFYKSLLTAWVLKLLWFLPHDSLAIHETGSLQATVGGGGGRSSFAKAKRITDILIFHENTPG